MILNQFLAFNIILQCNSRKLLVETERRSEYDDDTRIGSDYMGDPEAVDDKKMVDKKEQTVKDGESVDLKCAVSNGTISKCFYFSKNGHLIYKSAPGVSFEGGRIKCLCDVSEYFPSSNNDFMRIDIYFKIFIIMIS